MDTGIVVLIVVIVAIVSYANKMRKSWDVDNAEVTQNNDEAEHDSPYNYNRIEREEISSENLEDMPILDRVENFKFTLYTPPPFIPTTGSFETESLPDDDIISSFDYDQQSSTTHINSIKDFDLKNAVILSEILKPKWNS